MNMLDIFAQLSDHIANTIGQKIMRRADCQPNEVWEWSPLVRIFYDEVWNTDIYLGIPLQGSSKCLLR